MKLTVRTQDKPLLILSDIMPVKQVMEAVPPIRTPAEPPVE